MEQEILDAVDELTRPHNREFVLAYLKACEDMGATLQLDRPIIRVLRSDGVQVSTVDLPDASTFIITPQGHEIGPEDDD